MELRYTATKSRASDRRSAPEIYYFKLYVIVSGFIRYVVSVLTFPCVRSQFVNNFIEIMFGTECYAARVQCNEKYFSFFNARWNIVDRTLPHPYIVWYTVNEYTGALNTCIPRLMYCTRS